MPGAAWGCREVRAVIKRERWWGNFLKLSEVNELKSSLTKLVGFVKSSLTKFVGFVKSSLTKQLAWLPLVWCLVQPVASARARLIKRERWWETFLNIRRHWIEIIYDKAAGMAAPGTMPGAACGFSEAKADQERKMMGNFLKYQKTLNWNHLWQSSCHGCPWYDAWCSLWLQGGQGWSREKDDGKLS